MSKFKVVLWRPMYASLGHDLLAEGGADVVVVDSPNADEVKQVLHGASALWVRTPERVTAEVLDAGKDLVVDRAKRLDQAHEDVYLAVRDAFKAAERQLEDHARRLRGDVKNHGPSSRDSTIPPAEEQAHFFQNALTSAKRA